MPESYEDLARSALLEITPVATIGSFVSQTPEDDGSVTVRFASAQPGYPDWLWTVSVADVEGDEVPATLATAAVVQPIAVADRLRATLWLGPRRGGRHYVEEEVALLGDVAERTGPVLVAVSPTISAAGSTVTPGRSVGSTPSNCRPSSSTAPVTIHRACAPPVTQGITPSST